LRLVPGQWARIGAAELGFHPVRACVSVFSPVLFGAVLWGAWRGVRSRPWTLAPIAVLVVGQLAFVVFFVPVLDDRFLLPLAPGLVLAALAGWSTLEPRLRRRAAIGFVAAGLLLAADFHFAPPSFATYPVEILSARPGNSPWTRARGVGAASSVELRGWARHDEADPSRARLRADLWRVFEACERGVCIAAERNEGAVGRFGDQEWLRFEGLAARERTGLETFVVTTCPTRNDRLPQECVADLAIEPMPPDGPPRPPGCVDEGAWELHTVVDDPDGGRGVSVWRKTGAPVCSLPPR